VPCLEIGEHIANFFSTVIHRIFLPRGILSYGLIFISFISYSSVAVMLPWVNLERAEEAVP
jgi:hypothetical protein